jgi:hypothetical protein
MKLAAHGFLLWLAGLASLPVCAQGLAPGAAQGSARIDGEVVTLRHAYAHLHDNAEGLLDWPSELRILVADREVPPAALRGVAFFPAEELARQGRLRGLLMRLSPEEPQRVLVSVLGAPANPRESFLSLALGSPSNPAFSDWRLERTRVEGALEAREAGQGIRVRFHAGIAAEPPVSEDLRDVAARNSAQMSVFVQRAEALQRGDLDVVHRLSTEASYQRLRAALALLGPHAGVYQKNTGSLWKQQAAGVQRLVVRTDRAVAIFGPDQWSSFVRDAGAWKVAD